MTNFENKILTELVKKKIITDDVKENIEQELQGGLVDLDTILVRKKILVESELTKIKGDLMEVNYISLSGKEILSEVLNIIPLEISENYKMIAFEQDKNLLKVGLVNPYDIRAIEALDFLAKQNNLQTQIFIVSRSDYNDAFKKYENINQEIATALAKTEEDIEKDEGEIQVTEENIRTAPVSKIVGVIIRHGVEGGASDIHIEPEETKSRVRYRIDGVLHTSLTLPGYLHTAIVARIKVLAKLKLDETRIPQDGRIRLRIEKKKIDLRVSTLPLLEKEKVSMRILDRSKSIPSITELGFTGRLREIIDRNIKKPFGMILVTGPTGSGKTTTLYTLINQISSENLNITTLEDPIEYEISNVNQSQINPRIAYTFANGLRSILRQDPDVIMVGEIRDNETAEMAIHAGLTGHLLFSTLHTNNAFGAIPRLLDMQVEPFLLASTLNAVIAQRLVRTICDYCKAEIEIDSEMEKNIKQSLSNVIVDLPEKFKLDKKLKFYTGKGCAHCGNLGYKGRIAIGEILEITDNMKSIINEGCKFEDMSKEAKEQKMLTMQQSGFIKALEGVTTVEEVLRATEEKEFSYEYSP